MNSNPATIMTDPEFADATYVEPLLPANVRKVIEKERPDALLPTLGGQTALNLAKALAEDGTLEEFGVELIGANYDAINCAEDRDLFRAAMERAGLKMPESAIATTLEEALGFAEQIGLPAIVRPAFTLGGRGGGIAYTAEEFHALVQRGIAASPDQPDPHRQVRHRVGRVRARGHARPQRQRRDRLLHREPRPHGRAHGRLRHRRAAADAHGRALPAAPRPGHQGHPDGRRGDGRLERAVRGQPRDGGDPRHRDEPARLAVQRAGLEGHRLPDREDRRAPRGGLRARGDHERHHAGHPRELRADDRLRRREVAALRVREVHGGERRALHAHEERGGGHGLRAHVRPGVLQGHALPRARRRTPPDGSREGRAARAARASARGPLRRHPRRVPRGRHPRRGPRADEGRPLVPRRARAHRRGPRVALRGRGALLQVRGHLRGGVPRADALLLLRVGADGRARGRAWGQPLRGHPRRRAEPHRPGHRVRLLLRPRGDDGARERPRRRDGQLQPRDGLDGLRHVATASTSSRSRSRTSSRSSSSSSPRA